MRFAYRRVALPTSNVSSHLLLHAHCFSFKLQYVSQVPDPASLAFMHYGFHLPCGLWIPIFLTNPDGPLSLRSHERRSARCAISTRQSTSSIHSQHLRTSTPTRHPQATTLTYRGHCLRFTWRCTTTRLALHNATGPLFAVASALSLLANVF